jgi:hypothetical protein
LLRAAGGVVPLALATAPPDADRAIDCYREAARLAGATGNDPLRLWAEFGVTCAAVLDGFLPEAPEV